MRLTRSVLTRRGLTSVPGRSIVVAVLAAVLATQVACGAPGSEGRSSTDGAPLPPPAAGPVGQAVPIAPTTPTASLFVSPEGDDANAGTQVEPLLTLARAAELAKPGMRVVVATGAYDASITTEVSGTPEARISFVAETTFGAEINGQGAEGAAWLNTGDYVDIVGFDIGGDNQDGLLNSGSYVRIINNRVHGFANGNCITTANSGYTLHDIDVIGNVVFECGANQKDHGIYVSHPRGVVANNLAYDNAGYGIHCWHNCNQLAVSNNLVFNNDSGGIVIGQGDAPNDGRVAADHFTVSNNIVVHNAIVGITERGTTGPNNRYLNNLSWSNEAKNIDLRTGKDSAMVDADPMLVNYQDDGTGDYRPVPGSPAIDAGTPTGAPPTAIDGQARPLSKNYDIGPYEQ